MNYVTKKSTISAGKLALLGASIAGLAAAAYFFLGPKGKQHQKHAKAWAIKMKGDVIEKLEMARDVSESVYYEIIDAVAGDYEQGVKASKDDIQALAKDLKKLWKTISGSARAVKRDVMKGATNVAEKVKQ